MDHDDQDPGSLFEAFERRALDALPEDDATPADLDLVDALREGDAETEPVTEAVARDLTLGGYIALHNRVPAFEGIDAQPYTVDVDVEESEDERGAFGAFLLFIRWAATGAGIMDHLETPDVAFGESPEQARQAALDLSLYEIKAELDAAIRRRHPHED